MQLASIDDNDQPNNTRTGFFAGVGLLRIVLAILVLLCLPMVFWSGTGSAGWGLVPSQITPALVVLLVWALPFDILMARVFMSQTENGPERARYRRIITLDTLLIVALLLFWGPVFLRLFLR